MLCFHCACVIVEAWLWRRGCGCQGGGYGLATSLTGGLGALAGRRAGHFMSHAQYLRVGGDEACRRLARAGGPSYEERVAGTGPYECWGRRRRETVRLVKPANCYRGFQGGWGGAW